MTTATDLLVPALADSGMSRRALALATGSSEAGLNDVWHGRKDMTVGRLDRLLRPLGYTLLAVPSPYPSLSDTSAAVAQSLRTGTDDMAFRHIWNLALVLTRADPALRVALTIARPPTTGDARFDALLAGMAEHLLGQAALPLGEWLRTREPLDEPWDIEPVPSLRSAARAVTPEPLASRNVYLDPENFINA